jgi:hypothetical protein
LAIYRRLSEASFNDADIKCMTAAYEAALDKLRLNDREDPVTEVIASKVIQVFRSGEHDPIKICARTLTELGAGLRE